MLSRTLSLLGLDQCKDILKISILHLVCHKQIKQQTQSARKCFRNWISLLSSFQVEFMSIELRDLIYLGGEMAEPLGVLGSCWQSALVQFKQNAIPQHSNSCSMRNNMGKFGEY